MALDASWWVNDPSASLVGDSEFGVLIDESAQDATSAPPSTRRGSILKRLARFGVRVYCAAQLRAYRLLYRSTLAEVGSECVFGAGLIIQGHDRIRLGNDVRVNDYVFLQSGGDSELIIGNQVTISIGAKIMTGQYPVGPAGHDRSTHVYKTVTIGDGAWIGAGAVVLPGVRIGRNAIVAAGAVVTRDVPDGVLAVGAPAKVMRHHVAPPPPVALHSTKGSGDLAQGAA
jgi:acetyltransferase-like isoleucine patch superfamily enzyme